MGDLEAFSAYVSVMPSAWPGVVGVVGSSWFEGDGDGWVVGFGLGGVGIVGVLA